MQKRNTPKHRTIKHKSSIHKEARPSSQPQDYKNTVSNQYVRKEPAFNRNKNRPRQSQPYHEPKQSGSAYWIFGTHPIEAALANPNRRILRLVSTKEVPQQDSPKWERIEKIELERLLPPGAVHQGIAALVEPLEEKTLAEIATLAESKEQAILLILDGITDPHNVGAILRSAAAFGALAIIVTERNAAPQSGTLAKAASGALDIVPLIAVVNLAREMELLKKAGFWIVGLAGEATQPLSQKTISGKIALVLGAEGAGMRRLTREHCDLIVRLPIPGVMNHLNVSNAAAIALYELTR